jgi:hypothetical protein
MSLRLNWPVALKAEDSVISFVSLIALVSVMPLLGLNPSVALCFSVSAGLEDWLRIPDIEISSEAVKVSDFARYQYSQC